MPGLTLSTPAITQRRLDHPCRHRPLAIDQHRSILTAIDARDADAAEAALKLHLSEILKALPAV